MSKPKKTKQPTKPGTKEPAPRESSLKLMFLGWYGVIGLALSYVTPIKFPFAEGHAKDYWRHALGSLVLMLGLFAGLIALAFHFLDVNDFKSQIVDYVKTHKQRDLVLDGDINLTFFPKLGLDTGKMSLSQRNSSQIFAAVDNARLYVGWWALLRMQLQIERIVLDGAHANVVRYKDGSTNFDDLLATADRLGDVKFEVEKIRVLESSLHFQDEAAGLSLSLHDLDLETGKLADATAGEVRSRFRVESSQPRIDAKVNLVGHVLYDRASNRYEVANFEGQAQGEAEGIAQLALELRGSLAAHPTTQQLELDKVNAVAKGKLEQYNFETRFGADNLKLDRNQWFGTALTLAGSLTKEGETLKATLEVPAIEFDKKTIHSENVQAGFDLTRTGRALQGQFSSRLDFDPATRQLQLGAMTGNWSASHPLLAAKLNASATADVLARLPAQEIKLDFKTRIDDSQFTGNVQLKDFQNPAYAFDVAANTLDLDRYLVSDWAKRLQAEVEPFNLGGLKARNVRGKLRSEQLKVAKLKASQFVAEVRVEPSGLTIDPMEARLYGGTLQGGASITAAETPRFTLRQKLTGVQLDAMLADLLPGEARLSGKGSLAVVVNAEGRTFAELRKGLQGSASLALTRGSLAGLHLAEALVAGKAQLGIQGAERSDSVRLTESTPYSELKATLALAQGKAHTSDILLKSPLFASKGEGEVALESGELSLQLLTTVPPGLKRSSAGELAELSGITVPMRISGLWPTASITYRLGEASGSNLARLAKMNMAKSVASAADTSKPASK